MSGERLANRKVTFGWAWQLQASIGISTDSPSHVVDRCYQGQSKQTSRVFKLGKSGVSHIGIDERTKLGWNLARL